MIAPDAKQEIVGIRPGEKLHEQMIGAEDSHFTYEYPEHFKILPQINGWADDQKRIKDGVKVPEGFVYASDSNLSWMSDADLQAGLTPTQIPSVRFDVMIPYGRQDISQADIDAVVEVLRSDFLTQGPMVPRFEEAVAQYCGAQHAVAVNSATSALHIACLALDLGPGDWLWTSPNTFVASANCALYCGAKVDFVDIDPHTTT